MKIDLIIPCYKAHDTLNRCLCSIASQTVKDDITVTLVNDADGTNYDEYIDRFEGMLDVQVIDLEKNGGPGVARQWGMDHTTNPLIMFMDADDLLFGPFSVETLRDSLLKEDNNVMITSSFLEEQGDNFIRHERDMVWMFGKIYKREFIHKYDIHFPPHLRCNEDLCFHKQIGFYLGENEKVKSIANDTYYWMENMNSITRKNDYEYYYRGSVQGMVDAWIYSIRDAINHNGNKDNIDLFLKSTIGTLYAYYIQVEERKPQFEAELWQKCVEFYKTTFSLIRDKMTLADFNKSYEEAMTNAYARHKLFDCMPRTSFREFVRKLDKELDKSN